MTVRELIALLSEQDQDALAVVSCEDSGNDAPHAALGTSVLRLRDGRTAVSVYQARDYLNVDYSYGYEDAIEDRFYTDEEIREDYEAERARILTRNEKDLIPNR